MAKKNPIARAAFNGSTLSAWSAPGQGLAIWLGDVAVAAVDGAGFISFGASRARVAKVSSPGAALTAVAEYLAANPFEIVRGRIEFCSAEVAS